MNPAPESARRGDSTAGATAGTICGDASPVAAPRRIMVFGVVSVALLMGAVDQTIVATALHTLKHDLHASVSWVGWTITAYALGQILVLPLVGKLSDRTGRRRLFLASIAVFTGSSLLCGLANDIYVLVTLRAVQGVGGGAFVPLATGITVQSAGRSRDKAVGMLGSIFPIGDVLGPILGGLIVTYWNWRGIFLLNVPIGIALFVLCRRYLPLDTETGRDDREMLDVVGMLLLAGTVLPLMLAASYLGSSAAHPASTLFFAPIVLAFGAGTLFIRRARSVADSFIPPHLIYGRGFGAVNVINYLFGGVAAGLGSLIPLYAAQRYAISALGASSLLVARGVCIIVVSSIAALALRRTGYRRPMLVGFVVLALGILGLAFSPFGLTPYAWLAVAAGVTGLGMGISGPASRNASLHLAPEHATALAGLRTTCRQIGTITAVSIATAVLAHASDRGSAQAYVFVVSAAIMLLALPVVMKVPEHRGHW